MLIASLSPPFTQRMDQPRVGIIQDINEATLLNQEVWHQAQIIWACRVLLNEKDSVGTIPATRRRLVALHKVGQMDYNLIHSNQD